MDSERELISRARPPLTASVETGKDAVIPLNVRANGRARFEIVSRRHGPHQSGFLAGS